MSPIPRRAEREARWTRTRGKGNDIADICVNGLGLSMTSSASIEQHATCTLLSPAPELVTLQVSTMAGERAAIAHRIPNAVSAGTGYAEEMTVSTTA